MPSTPPPEQFPWQQEYPLLKTAGRLARFAGWSIDAAQGELYWSSELFDLLGFDERLGQPRLERTLQLYPDEERVRIQAALDRCMTDGDPLDFEGTILDSAGNRLRIRVVAEAIRDESGVIVRLDGAFYDISEIVREREERIAAQDALRRTLDYIPNMVCFVDREWRLTFANAAVFAVAPGGTTDLLGRTIWDLFPDLEGTALEQTYRRAMDHDESSTSRALLPRFDLWIEGTAHPIENGVALFVRDVTAEERQHAEVQALTQQALALSAMLDISNEAFITEDPENRVTYWNRGAEQLYGWSKDEAIGRNIRDLIYVDTSEFEVAAAELLETGRWAGELHQQSRDGRPVIVACRWQAVLDEAGQPVSLFAVNSDVTELRRQQELQSRAQRLESLGTLAGGIAHDLNNMLTPVLMSIQLMKHQHPTDAQAELLGGMESGVLRGAEMIRQVLSFARGVDGARDAVELADLMDELSALTLVVLPKSITVEKELPPVPPLAGDATQILQVLVNLVTNARDAMPEGGLLRITAAEVEVGASSPLASALERGRYVSIGIDDSGIGMSSDVQDRIFEPFFTTKGIGEGTGLGLASSQAIARSHGGYIEVESEVGRGSRFSLYLPVAERAGVDDTMVDAPTDGLPRGNDELILVVDDEASIRSVVCQTLQAHGYRTVQASNGREAIEVYNAHDAEISLVLTDMMMPVMDGAATAAFFSEHYPHVPLVASSGLNAASAVERAREVGMQFFVAKPFTADTLLRTLRDALVATHGR